MKPVHIRWFDHQEPHNDNVWWTADDLKELDGPAVIESVGYVIRDEQGWLAIVGQITEDGMTSQPLILVKSCILTMNELEPTQPPKTGRRRL